MKSKKLVCVLAISLMLVGMSCTCSLFDMILGESIEEMMLNEAEELIEELEGQLPEELEDVAEELEEAVGENLEDLTEEEAEEILESVVDEILEEEDEVETTEEESIEEEAEVEMGSQPNWSLVATGCDEFYEQGEEVSFEAYEDFDELIFSAGEYIVLLDLDHPWWEQNMLQYDPEIDNPSSPDIYMQLDLLYQMEHLYEMDQLFMYWEYDESENHIWGYIDFDAHAIDPDTWEEIDDCTISGQFAFDNVPVE